jgi:hypothetical protein
MGTASADRLNKVPSGEFAEKEGVLMIAVNNVILKKIIPKFSYFWLSSVYGACGYVLLDRRLNICEQG